MHNIITYIATLILGGALLCGCHVKDNYTAEYNLDFRMNLLDPIFWLQPKAITWQPNPEMFWATIQPSLLMGGSREHPFKLIPLSIVNKIPMKVGLQQRILLPETDALTAEVKLTCRKQNMKRAHMVISGISEQEAIVRSDTLAVAGVDMVWHTVSRTVSIENTPVLQLAIECIGSDSLLDQSLWLDKVEIYLNGKNIDSYPLRYSTLRIGAEDVTHLSFTDAHLYGDIPELKSKRVVAFGESVHGCRTVTQAAVQLLKHQVLNNRCRLILLQLPIEEALSYNRFVQGDERFCRDGLMVSFPTLLSRDLIVNDLLVWLKEYNRSRDDKVWLTGMGVNADPKVRGMWLFDYCYALRQSNSVPVLDSLMMKVLDYESVLKTLAFVESNREALEAALGRQELAMLRYCLSASSDIRASESIPTMDEVMYRSATFLMDILCPEPASVAIYAHAGHVDYLGEATALGKSFGARMKNLLGDDYSCIGVTVGKGKILTAILPAAPLKRARLSPLSPGSLERHALRSVSDDYFYLKTSKIPEAFFRTRFAGSTLMRYQSNELSVPKRRMDGIIFIRHGKAAEYNKEKFGHQAKFNKFIEDKFLKNSDKCRAILLPSTPTSAQGSAQ
jgi:erythromycin esterase-like protein